MLRTNELRASPHSLPHEKCDGIHVEQSNLVSTGAWLAINTNGSEKPSLIGFHKIGSHAYRGSILGVLHFV